MRNRDSLIRDFNRNSIQSMARLPGLGRTAGAAPYVAIAVGIISGQYIFNQPLKDYVAKQPANPPN